MVVILRWITILLLCFVCSIFSAANAALTRHLKDLGKLPILADGREKPLLVHAKARLRTMTGQRDRHALEHYVHLSQGEDPGLTYSIHHQTLLNRLNLSKAAVPLAVLLPLRESAQLRYLELEAHKQQKGSEGRAWLGLLEALGTYEQVKNGADWLLPVRINAQLVWSPLAALLEAGQFSDTQDLIKFAQAQYQPSWRIPLEYIYESSGLRMITFLTSLLALGLFFLRLFFKTAALRPLSWLAFALVLGMQIAEIATRVLISGRGPVTNMFETVLWVGLGMLLFGLVLSVLKQNLLYILAALSGFTLTSMMNNFARSMVNPDIHPLVPVLRDNFWLSTHVTTVTISYAAFALSWLVANGAILTYLIKKDDSFFGEAAKMAYEANKIGLVLILAGTILGGVWADYSWGRFWGWDPKETWALIVAVTYAIFLHGRHMGYLKNAGFIACQAGGFLTVMFAWFGVNYILASGLHSYGFSQNGSLFLLGFFAVQIGILGLYALRLRQPKFIPEKDMV